MAVLAVAVLLAAAVLVLERIPPSNREPSVPGRVGTGMPDRGVPAPSPVLPEKPATARKITVIIDDIGYDRRILRELAEIPAPIAFAILPFTPHAVEAAELLHAAGKEIILHLPMEPHSYPATDPGKGALFTDMATETLRSRLAAALKGVPHASGINNHMGSRFMEDEVAVAAVMEELAKKGLFFVDSLTTPASRGKEAAARAGVPFAARSSFIDHPPNDGAVFDRLTHLPRRGRTGSAPLLLIGHPRSETLRALTAALPVWRKRGIEVISVAAFLAETPAGGHLPGRGNS
jgi:hypothetical protein